MVTIANDKNTGPMPNANPNPPMANKTAPNAQIKPMKILLNMINPQNEKTTTKSKQNQQQRKTLGKLQPS
jgi:hypothetical protein